jgi:hypothetical protein
VHQFPGAWKGDHGCWWPIGLATVAGRGVCLSSVYPPPECRGAATTGRMSAIGSVGVGFRSKFFRGCRKSWRQLMTLSRGPRKAGLFDHPVSECKLCWRYRQAYLLGGLHVDDILKLSRLDYREIGRPCAFENAANVKAG